MDVIKVLRITEIPHYATKEESTHKFLHASLLGSLHFYKDKHNKQYMSFFDTIHFALITADSVEDANVAKVSHVAKGADALCYWFYHGSDTPESMGQEKISLLLRGSKTLETKERSFVRENIHTVIAEKGTWIYEQASGEGKQTERLIILVLLALAYNLYAEALLKQTSEAYDSKDTKKLSAVRETVAAYDVKCFYANPVVFNRHQLYEFWNFIAKLFNTQHIHDEVRTQIGDIAAIIESKYRDRQEARYKRIEVMLALVGTTLGVLALI